MPNATNARDDAGNTATSLQIVNRADQADSELSSMSLYASYKPRLVFWFIFRGFTPVLLNVHTARDAVGKRSYGTLEPPTANR